MPQLSKRLRSRLPLFALAAALNLGTAALAEEGQPSEQAQAMAEMRQSYRDMIPAAGLGEEVAEIRNLVIEAEGREIPIRLYFPAGYKSEAALPVLIFCHGGGFVSGDLDTHEVLCRAIANRGQCLVLAVDYRLAPENPFPAGLEDLYASLHWLREKAAELGANPDKIVIAGDSAGGNLSAALTLLMRERGDAPLIGQWLMYPTLSSKMDTESWQKLGSKYFPTLEVNEAILQAYVQGEYSREDILISPLNADLKGLPPALIQAAGLDPLRDEARDYALKLGEARIPVQFMLYSRYGHGFLQFFQDGKNFPEAEIALEQGLLWLKARFAQ